jgi:hypothetical protein
MKSILHLALACMTGVAVGSWTGDVAAADGATARAKLAEARAAAAKWQPDAALVTLSTLRANDDGTAPSGMLGWTYTFHSPKTGKWLAYTVGAGGGLESQPLPAGLKVRVPDAFIDSDKILPEVAKHGFKKSGDTMLQLNVYYNRNLKPGVYWCATSAADFTPPAGPRSWCVDPTTGKFVARLDGGSAEAPQAAKPAAAGNFSVDLSKCGGFAAADAAGYLGVAAAQVKAEAAKVTDTEWKCTYSAGGKALAFMISSAPSVKEAEARIEQYRKTLKDDYTELTLNNGTEGIWSNASSTLTARRGNIIVRTRQPAGKVGQAKLADSVAAKF